MASKLTDAGIRALPPPSQGNRIFYDSGVTGLGIRVTASGARSFVLNYRTRLGRERRFTIGSFPDWTVGAARVEAIGLKRQIDRGGDPLGEIKAERAAPTVADLCARFEAEHLPRKRVSTQTVYGQQIAAEIMPALGRLKVASVTFADVDGLHRAITKRGRPCRANRVLSLLSRMFNLAIRWGWHTDNPAKGVERNQEHKRRRYLSADELTRLTKALDECSDQQSADIIRLLLLTGARRGEVLQARWDDFDLATGTWRKPGATTKQKTEHQVPLSLAARQLLTGLRQRAAEDAEWLFPAASGSHRRDVARPWARICNVADIRGARVHDLRHTYASVLASAGLSLPIIGQLLGHTTPTTTARYAHLFDDPLRAAAERAGAIITGAAPAEVVLLPPKTLEKRLHELERWSGHTAQPAPTALETKILTLIGPAPEERNNCLLDVWGALISMYVAAKEARLQRHERILLNKDILKALRTIKNALAAGADWVVGPNTAESSYEEFRRLYEAYKLGVDFDDRLSRDHDARKLPRRDLVMTAAVIEAENLLKVHGKDPPAVTEHGTWHQLARILYHSHGGRGDVWQAIRDTRVKRVPRPRRPLPTLRPTR